MVFLRRLQFSYLPVRADGLQGTWAHRCTPLHSRVGYHPAVCLCPCNVPSAPKSAMCSSEQEREIERHDRRAGGGGIECRSHTYLQLTLLAHCEFPLPRAWCSPFTSADAALASMHGESVSVPCWHCGKDIVEGLMCSKCLTACYCSSGRRAGETHESTQTAPLLYPFVGFVHVLMRQRVQEMRLRSSDVRIYALAEH